MRTNHMSALPGEIILNILVKLPNKTIRQCKRVCKEWRNIISDRIFVETHYKNSRISIISYRGKDRNKEMCMLESNKVNGIHEFESWKLNLTFMKENYEIVNSCRGILLLKMRFWVNCGFQLFVCNPLTGEYIILPNIKSSGYYYGLGFSSSTEQYKVVKLVTIIKEYYEVEIHTIGSTGGWRSCIKEGSYRSVLNYLDPNPIELNGALHWLATSNAFSNMEILCFDVEKEELDLMSLPWLEYSGIYPMTIGVVNALLCISLKPPTNNSLELWVMKDYGVKESWIQILVMKDIPREFTVSIRNIYRLVENRENGEFVLLVPSLHLISYDPTKESITILRAYDDDLEMKVQLYIPSFFSLRDYK